jgi:hypothetical protein
MTDIELLQLEQCLDECFEPFICPIVCAVVGGLEEVINEIFGACALTLMYGEQSIEVELLRDYRDNVLSQTPEGREIIKLYYQWSPVIVRAMQEDGAFKQEIIDIVDEIFPMLSR